MTVLDIGCNAGYYSFELAKLGAKVTGMDSDDHYLRQAKWAAIQLDLQDKVSFEKMELYDLKNRTDSYDLVLFLGVFYHYHTIWQRKQISQFSQLTGDLNCDVAVVGGGITGLTAALILSQAGANVILIEMNQIGGGTTGASTGHLDNHYDQRLSYLVKTFGLDSALKVMCGKRQAIEHIENWVRKYDLDCGFKRIPAYLYTENGNEKDIINKEYDSALSIGLSCSVINPTLPFEVKRGIRFEDQARFSPLAYTYGLADNIVKSGSQIFENTRMQDFSSLHHKITVTTPKGNIITDNLVLCGHTSLAGKLTVQPKITPRLSFVTAFEVEDEIEDALYWDTNIPYFYTRILDDQNPRTLIIGGADRHLGSESVEQSYQQLKDYASNRYKIKELKNYWLQEFFEPADGLPFAGKMLMYDNVYIASAFSGDGLTFGTMAAKIICDLIQKRENRLAQILDPIRIKPIASASKVANVLTHTAKHFTRDRFVPKTDISQIPNGQGKVIKKDHKIQAVYKEDDGTVHAVNAKCRHMGCMVHWNSADKTWDCPCHGGRYDKFGNLIAGPPREPLLKVEKRQTVKT